MRLLLFLSVSHVLVALIGLLQATLFAAFYTVKPHVSQVASAIPSLCCFKSATTLRDSGRGYSKSAHLFMIQGHVNTHAHNHIGPAVKGKIFRETLFVQYSQKLRSALLASPFVKIFLSYWVLVPSVLRQILRAMHPADFACMVLFNLMYRKALRVGHNLQSAVFKLLKRSAPFEYDKSILGFVEKRSSMFVQLLGFNYAAKLSCSLLIEIGLRIRPDFADILSRLSYLFYIGNFLDLFKSKFVHIFFPSLTEDRRKNYVFNRSVSVALWFVTFLIACEMVSTYLKVPLSSTLAFGGVGGVALGLSAKDIAANYLGGMMLLFNEPFTPGDMVTFKVGQNELIGRVERVGWGQTRIRGRDTRPTYVPNSQFTQLAVTNMDRITHRKFEAKIPIRFQDQHLMPEVLSRIRETLRTIPKLDTLSMPYRVHFIGFGQFSLDIEIVCYFATKSVDEFLSLQQVANIEILKAINNCGAMLALPTTVMMTVPGPLAYLMEPTTLSSVAGADNSSNDDFVAVMNSVNSMGSGVSILSPPMDMKPTVGQPPPAAGNSSTPAATGIASVTTAPAARPSPTVTLNTQAPTKTALVANSIASPTTAAATINSPSSINLEAIARASQVLSTNAPVMRLTSTLTTTSQSQPTIQSTDMSTDISSVDKSTSKASQSILKNYQQQGPQTASDLRQSGGVPKHLSVVDVVDGSNGNTAGTNTPTGRRLNSQLKHMYRLGNRKVSPPPETHFGVSNIHKQK